MISTVLQIGGVGQVRTSGYAIQIYRKTAIQFGLDRHHRLNRHEKEHSMNTGGLLEQVVEAHGGRSRWQTVESIEASLSSGGFAFASRLQPFALLGLKIRVNPHGCQVVLEGFCRDDCRGIWTPNHVQIRNANDVLVCERQEPRKQFRRWVKQFRWDKLDILYFAGYALWNYLSFPFVLDLPGVVVAEKESANAQASSQLVASFPLSVPTHSATQSFHLDASHLLVRHDYTADVIGSWAHAANCCLASERVDGLRFYTRRKVYPLLRQRTVLSFPILVWIELDDIKVKMAESPAPPALHFE